MSVFVLLCIGLSLLSVALLFLSCRYDARNLGELEVSFTVILSLMIAMVVSPAVPLVAALTNRELSGVSHLIAWAVLVACSLSLIGMLVSAMTKVGIGERIITPTIILTFVSTGAGIVADFVVFWPKG